MGERLENPETLTKERIRKYCRGDTESWFARLCAKSFLGGTITGGAIRRDKITMLTGETLPVPAEAHNRVKAGLDRRISGLPGIQD